MKLWGGRFRKPISKELEDLGRSIDFDRRFAVQEIRVNRAYARALARVRRLSGSELETIERGLEAVEKKLSSGPSLFLPSDEDIHTAIERLLGDEVGEVAGMLPAGRSRNDLAATDFRLFLAEAIQSPMDGVQELQHTLLKRAEESRGFLLPGYTHMRRGQPVVFAHYLLAYFWALERDRERLDRSRSRCLELPLGAGALAGNPFGVDRDDLAVELGFESVLENSIDAVSSRDHVLEFLATGAILATGLSRIAEDVLLWSSAEYGFVELAEAYATGSSLMPQKRNPDGLELVRGKCGRVVGNLMALLTTVKGLPTGYQRDLQEDKEPVFDTLDTLAAVLPVVNGSLATMTIHPEAMMQALSSDLLATDLADYLVEKGVSFREAHHIVGGIFVYAADRGVDPCELNHTELQQFSSKFDEDVARVWSYRNSVERRSSRGGVSTKAVEEQLKRARAIVKR